jgi:hypothetical protein
VSGTVEAGESQDRCDCNWGARRHRSSRPGTMLNFQHCFGLIVKTPNFSRTNQQVACGFGIKSWSVPTLWGRLRPAGTDRRTGRALLLTFCVSRSLGQAYMTQGTCQAACLAAAGGCRSVHGVPLLHCRSLTFVDLFALDKTAYYYAVAYTKFRPTCSIACNF